MIAPNLTLRQTLRRLLFARSLKHAFGVYRMARYLAIRGVPMHLAVMALAR
jgi:hypothetical protein